MSLLRTATRRSLKGRRLVSTTSAVRSDHGNGTSASEEQFPPETFFTPFWRNTVLIVAGIAGLSYYAPEASNKTYLAEWLNMYKTSVQDMESTNTAETIVAMSAAEMRKQRNQLPLPTFSYRTPQGIPHVSPHGMPVGFNG